MTLAALATLLVAGVGGAYVVSERDDDGDGSADSPPGTVDPRDGGETAEGDPASSEPDETPTTTRPPYDGWVDPGLVGEPWSDTVDGILTFRGGPTRSWYGTGPVPRQPQVAWRFPPSGGLCSQSVDQHGERTWCGTGWTGEPAVFERDGRTWVVFGAYDRKVHFLDAATGQQILPDFPTGDLIKGSVTIDPDGYPLVYVGSRDNYYRVLAIDRPEPTELWKLPANAVSPTKWNDDWDSSGLVIDDFLFEGGENSQWHIVKLNRRYGPDGLVTVAPELVFHAPGWDDELMANLNNQEVSIENSLAISGNTMYFANSGGLVQGWDISGVAEGVMPTRVFRFWTGDDTDASIVIDEDGMLYVASEYERGNARSQEIGQLMKLDPSKPDNPLVWSIHDHDVRPAGLWSTPALYGDVIYAATNGGRFMGVDRHTGAVLWTKQLPGPTWQSPVVVDHVLIEGDCTGVLHAYDVSNPRIDPPEIWQLELGGCIESTPAVWKGRIFLGTRAGGVYGIADAVPPPIP